MLSAKQQTSRSPTESVQTDSIRTAPTNRLISQQSELSSVGEEDKGMNAPQFTQSTRRQSKSKSKSKSTSESSSGSSPVQSPKKSTNTSTNAPITTNPMSSLRPNTQPDNSQGQNNFAQQNPNQTTTPSESKQAIPGIFGRVSARDIENEKSPSAANPQSQNQKSNQSTFERVDTHGGGTVYLGSGSIPELEDCIRNCLSCSQPHRDYIYSSTKYSFPYKSLTRASVLEDYSYDGISSYDRHILRSIGDHVSYSSSGNHHRYYHRSPSRHYSDHYYCDDCHHSKRYHCSDHHHSDHCHCHDHHHSDHCHGRDYKIHASDLCLDEIRQVNDALTKCGVSVSSHHNNQSRPVKSIISACQQILADPALGSHNNATNAVQHVWDNLHYHSPQTNMYGYASPAVQSVASHLFNPQHPYSPVQSVASHLFPYSQQSPYNPAPSAVSHLFSNPQQSAYNPAPSAAPAPYGYPQQSAGAGQSAISRLFGGGGGSGGGNPQPQAQPPPSSGQSVLANLFGGGGQR